jgi:hypothetical protein
MRLRPSVLVPVSLVVLSIAGVFGLSCAQPPSEPSSIAGATQGAGAPAAPTPTPPPARCTCTSVSVQFDPGGATPAWGAYLVNGNSNWRVGFRINVTCTGTGQSNKCTVFQIENGTLTFTIGGKNGQIVGKEKKVTKFHKGTLTDPWQKEYSDALGADYPANATDTMSITLDMEFEIKCVSSDGQSISKRFKVQGSVDAQAASRGAKPTLSGGTITFTPLG